MAYTTIDDPSAYFQTTLYSGTGSSQAVTNTGNSDLQPDWVWIKVRSNGIYGHAIFDSVRGVNKVINSNTTNAEEDQSSDVSLSSFNSDGFTVGGYFNNVNQSGHTFVSWQWKAGTAFTNDASATGIGSIDSSGSVNTDAGFSIVSFTASGSTGTVKHGLSTSPKIVIIKDRAATSNWYTYHNSIGNTKAMYLDLTNAESGASANFWNNTSPTTSVFSIGSAFSANAQIAYCFAEKQGYSKFGSYTGNGSTDGPFVYLGFKPAFIILKNTGSTADWVMFDNKRNGYNTDGNEKLYPNNTNAEADISEIDFLSNGFKVRAAGGENNFPSGNTLIYMAFAENPFVNSNGVPNNAR